LGGYNFFIGGGRDRGVGGCGGRGSRETAGWVRILRLAKWYPEGEEGKEEVIHPIIVDRR
jgi:hypothetical protein